MSSQLPSLSQNHTAELKESILNRQPARARKNRHRASILLSKDGFSRSKNTKAIEEKLGEQFRYFRQEFLEAALSIGVPVPLDMVEDKAGRVYTFVNQKGPRYLFQIMHSNPESAHLLRVSLSLLIITLSILRGKLPQNTGISPSNSDKSHATWINLLSENVSTWALDSLTNIADGSSVAICTNLLRHSHSQTTQELILNLLAQLVNITEEAANQMLLYPTITPNNDQANKSHDGKDVEPNDSRSPTLSVNRSNLLSSGSQDTQQSSSSTSQSIFQQFPKPKRQSFVSNSNFSIATSPNRSPKSKNLSARANSSVLLSSINPHSKSNYNNNNNNSNNNNNNNSNSNNNTNNNNNSGNSSNNSNSLNEQNYTCLSYMFSVVAHHRNRYTVMTACAEVVLALIANKSPMICEAIARTSISSTLVDISDHDSRTSGMTHNFGHNISSRIHAAETAESEKKSTKKITHGHSSSGQQNQSTEWAALKLMLKFLQRFMRYATNENDEKNTTNNEELNKNQQNSQSLTLGGIQSSSIIDPVNNSTTTTTTTIPISSTADGLPHQHKNSLSHAHSRVLLAVCELIIYSPVVASYVLTMPGARAIIKSSCLLHKRSSEIGMSVIQCLEVLQKESERVYELVSSNRHSQSYELTHGRSSKLFNPVAVLARREGPSPRLISRPSTTANGPSFGSQKKLQTQPSFHRTISSKYSSPRNPFTTEFSIPLQDGHHADILIVNHDDNNNDEEHNHDHEDFKFQQNNQQSPTAKNNNNNNNNNNTIDESSPSKIPQILIKKSFSADLCSDREADTDAWFSDYDLNDDKKPKRSNSNQFNNNNNNSYEHGYDEEYNYEESNKHEKSFQPLNQNKSNNNKNINKNSGGINNINNLTIQTNFKYNEDKDFPATSPSPSSSKNKIVYNIPESPIRRGLKEHQIGTSVSLHRDLFSSLPSKPAMPQRLEAEDIINGNNSKLDNLDASLKQSLSISSPIVSSAHNSGFYVNGKCSIPIVEKARRVYIPKELSSRPSTASNSKEINKQQRNNSLPTNQQRQHMQQQQQSQQSQQQVQNESKSHLQLNENEFSPLILDDYEKFADDNNNNTLESILSQNLILENNYNSYQNSNSNRKGSTNNQNNIEGKNVYKLSEGLQKSQIIQSYDILFP